MRNAPIPHAWIDDVLISVNDRGHGVGNQFIKWIETQIRSEGISMLFLESGIENAEAHAFFDKNGYSTCSRVMQKVL